MVSFLATFGLTWKVFLASWRKDWKSQQKAVVQLGSHFAKDIPVVSNLMWNVIMFTMMQGLLLRAAGFPPKFLQFSVYAVLIPQLVGSISYYCYKYGIQEALTSLSGRTLIGWLQNWFAMQGIALTNLMQSSVFYFGGIWLQRYLLPAEWDFFVQFPREVYEDYLPVCVYWFWGLFAFCSVTLPLWKRGYILSMEAAGRSNVTITYTETFMELLYQTSQANSLLFLNAPIAVILQEYTGFRLYFLHMVFAGVEAALVNYVVSFKFCILHQIMHEIQPLYAMAHMEHHICKGIHPTTSAAGLWEFWVCGQSIFFTIGFGLNPIPYALLQSIYMGANVVVHTMWPSPKLFQWHTLHHTVLADVYNVNIPGPYDREHSKSVAKLQGKLQELSPFVKFEPLSDLVSFAFIGASGAILHYGFGLGLGHVNFDLQYHQ